MKRSTFIISAALLAVLTMLIGSSAVKAQLFTYTGTTTVTSNMTTTSTSSPQAATTTTSSTSSVPSSTSPLPVPVVEAPTSLQATATTVMSGYMQFNSLMVQTVTPTMMVATVQSSTYDITIDAATQLLLSDRTSAVLGNFTPGDLINVYGFSDGMGNIDAQIVRDLSKPVMSSSTLTPTSSSTLTLASMETEITQIQAIIVQILAQISQVMSSTSMAATSTTTTY